MAGQLTIDTLKASSGVLATQNGMTGICKAWVNYNASAQTVTSSFNVSSITYNATGDYTLNFATSMTDANYLAVGSARGIDLAIGHPLIINGNYTVAPTTSAYRFNASSQWAVTVATASAYNSNAIYLAVFGA